MLRKALFTYAGTQCMSTNLGPVKKKPLRNHPERFF